MAINEDKIIKVRLSSKNEGGYNTIKGRLFKDPIDADVNASELAILQGEAPHIIIDTVPILETVPDEEELSAKDLVEKIKTITSIEEVAALFTDEKRVTVVAALKARMKELKAALKAQ